MSDVVRTEAKAELDVIDRSRFTGSLEQQVVGISPLSVVCGNLCSGHQNLRRLLLHSSTCLFATKGKEEVES